MSSDICCDCCERRFFFSRPKTGSHCFASKNLAISVRFQSSKFFTRTHTHKHTQYGSTLQNSRHHSLSFSQIYTLSLSLAFSLPPSLSLSLSQYKSTSQNSSNRTLSNLKKHTRTLSINLSLTHKRTRFLKQSGTVSWVLSD